MSDKKFRRILISIGNWNCQTPTARDRTKVKFPSRGLFTKQRLKKTEIYEFKRRRFQKKEGRKEKRFDNNPAFTEKRGNYKRVLNPCQRFSHYASCVRSLVRKRIFLFSTSAHPRSTLTSGSDPGVTSNRV